MENLPILLVSGAEDPVGDYGKGVESVADGLKATGHGNVTMKLYPGCIQKGTCSERMEISPVTCTYWCVTKTSQR